MTRRGFFGRLAGVAAAGAVIPAGTTIACGERGPEMVATSGGQTTIVLKLDGRELARHVVDALDRQMIRGIGRGTPKRLLG